MGPQVDKVEPNDQACDALVTNANLAEAPFTVTVYAASSFHVPQEYKDAAKHLGEVIAKIGWRQLNGGGRGGLMGACTEGGREADGVVDAVILDIFTSRNQHPDLGNVVVTNNMTDRKKGLYDGGDAFIALPGGLGTLEEILEIMSWRQLQFHTKPIVLLNTGGFYTKFYDFLMDAMQQMFISEGFKDACALCDTPEEAIDYIAHYSPFVIDKSTIYASTAPKTYKDDTSDWAAAATAMQQATKQV